MACTPDYRQAVLDPIATYLADAAHSRGQSIADITADQQRYVLGPLYRMLESFHEAYLCEAHSEAEADAKAVEWLSERLAEFKRL